MKANTIAGFVVTRVGDERAWSFLPSRLGGSLAVLQRCVEALEANATYVAVTPCEPQLGPRGLDPTMSTRDSGAQVRTMMNLLAYADGRHDLIAIADRIGEDVADCAALAAKLLEAGVIRRC